MATDIALKDRSQCAALRADFWHLAAQDTSDPLGFLQNMLDSAGPALDVCRATYGRFTDTNAFSGHIQREIEWHADGVKPSLGTKVPAYLAKYLLRNGTRVL